MTSIASSAEAHPSIPLAVFLADPTVGIVLTGDSWLCDLAIRHLLGSLPPSWAPLFVQASTDLTALNDAVRPDPRRPSPHRVAILRATSDLEPDAAAVCRRAQALVVIAHRLEELPPGLEERCALVVPLGGPPGSQLALAFQEQPPRPPHADQQPISVAIDDIAAVAVEGASNAGIVSHELEYRAATAARAAAGLGFDPAQVLDLWVYGPRRPAPQPPPPSSPPAADRSPSTPSEGEGSGDGPESIDSPTAVPTASAAPRSLPGRTRRPLPGRRGPRAPHPSRGRPGRSLSWNRGHRPDIPATLAWALPRLPLRGWRPGDPVRLSPGDLRHRLRKSRSGRLQLIVLDASGSMARDAIRRAKGVALAMLDQAYIERCSVAVVVARGRSAYLALPPTRSTRRVAECLRRLPAGGGTPLASAYLLAARLAERFDLPSVKVLILTDQRPNVALGPGRDPRADADIALAALRARATEVQIQPIARRTGVRA